MSPGGRVAAGWGRDRGSHGGPSRAHSRLCRGHPAGSSQPLHLLRRLRRTRTCRSIWRCPRVLRHPVRSCPSPWGFGRGLMSKRGTPAPEDLAGQGGLVETKGSRGCLGAVGGDVPGGNAGDSWSRCSRPKGLTSRIAWNLSLSWKPCGRPPPSAAPGTQTRDGGRLVARAARGFRAQSMLTEARSCAGQPGPGDPRSGAADLTVAWSGSRATRPWLLPVLMGRQFIEKTQQDPVTVRAGAQLSPGQ